MKSKYEQIAISLNVISKPSVIRGQSLSEIEDLRKNCMIYLANSEKFLRVRAEQSVKSVLRKELLKNG